MNLTRPAIVFAAAVVAAGLALVATGSRWWHTRFHTAGWLPTCDHCFADRRTHRGGM